MNPKAMEHPVQRKLFDDLKKGNYRNFIVAAGRRSFKTERFAKRHIISLVVKDENWGKIYFAGAPTMMQAKAIFWNDLKKLSPPCYVKRKNETEMTIEYNNDCIIKVVGLHEFRRVQGQLLHGIVISEYQDCEPGVYNESIEPMINDTRGWCIKEGRPMGKNHFYDDFLKGKQSARGWHSYHWTSEDNLELEQRQEANANLAKSA